MRGGTSRALFFHRCDLPPAETPHDNQSWNEIFRGALGSPDSYGRQLDGMGGGQSSLSKIAIVSPSERPDADVDFTFAQVGISDDTVGYRGNCGNISSAVGPFAIDEGMVSALGDTATVRIFNTNTRKLIVANFALENGKAAARGDYTLPGIPGTGAPIRLSFIEPGGAATGQLLPTGATRETLVLDNGARIEVSLIDAANPVVALMAREVGLTGAEAPSELRGNGAAMDCFEQIRVAAAVRMGLVDKAEEARTRLRNLPLVALLADRPRPMSADAGHVPSDFGVRVISAGLPHGAIPLTGAMCLAVAARIPGSLVQTLLSARGDELLRIAHASGIIDVAAKVEMEDDAVIAREAVVYRTARRLMDGRVFIPA
jgi:2-methylaconitate cis-trans-isomerase PrpF